MTFITLITNETASTAVYMCSCAGENGEDEEDV